MKTLTNERRTYRGEPARGRIKAVAGGEDLLIQADNDIAGDMSAILADVFSLYFKTRTFHSRINGPYSRDYRQLLDEQADQLYAMADAIGHRVGDNGRWALRSIDRIGRLRRLEGNDAPYVDPLDMLTELREDNEALRTRLRGLHQIFDEHRAIATASCIESWIDETEQRSWFLSECNRCAD